MIDQGGEVLLLIGDAVLAIFPTAEAGDSAAASKALAAARETGVTPGGDQRGTPCQGR